MSGARCRGPRCQGKAKKTRFQRRGVYAFTGAGSKEIGRTGRYAGRVNAAPVPSLPFGGEGSRTFSPQGEGTKTAAARGNPPVPQPAVSDRADQLMRRPAPYTRVYWHSLNMSWSALFPARVASDTVAKNSRECAIGLRRPALKISHRHCLGGSARFFTTTEKSS